MNHLVHIFKLLSDETRIRIIMLLNEDQLCVCQITGILNISQPKASKVLSKLRDLGLVTDERKEKFVYYSLNKDHDLLKHIIGYIKDNISDYDLVNEDYNRLVLKEDFLTNCSKATLKV